MTSFQTILYETPAPQVARIVQAMQTSFALHQLAHTHWLKLHNMLIDPSGLPPETARALGARLEGRRP